MSYIGSVFCLIAFLAEWFSMWKSKKTDEKINAISWLCFSFSITLCLIALCAGIINLVHIPVTKVSVGIICTVLAGVNFVRMKRYGVQKYNWDKLQIIGAVFIAVLVYYYFVKNYGWGWNFVFRNSDAAVHMQNGLAVLKSGHISGMYFASLFNGILYGIFGAFIPRILWYRIYLLSELVMFFAEILTFSCVLFAFCKNKKEKLLSYIVTILYTIGYPLLSFEMNFYYWGIAVMFVAVSAFMIKQYKENIIERKIIEFYLMLLCFGVFISYMMVAPAMYFAIFFSLVIIKSQEGKILSGKNIVLALKVFLLPCVLGFFYSFYSWFVKNGMDVAGTAVTEGGIYTQLYTDFMFLIPFAVYYLVGQIVNKKIDVYIAYLLSFGIITIAMLIMLSKGKMSRYYYTKSYYPLWFVLFLVTFLVLIHFMSTQKELLFTIILIVAGLRIVDYKGIETWLLKDTELTDFNYSQKMFSLYNWNKMIANNPVIGGDEFLPACEWVLENGADKDIPLIAGGDVYYYQYYYDALTGENSSWCCGWWYSVDELKQKFDNEDIEFAVIVKEGALYNDNQQFWDSFDVVNQYGQFCVIHIN